MKKYDLIVGFGCSFTEGGGLDNPDVYKFLNKIEDDVDYSFPHKAPIKFKNENNYIVYLSELLNCEYVNLAESQSSNDLIFQKIYNHTKHIPNIGYKTPLFIIQLTMFSRLHVYYDYIKDFVKLNRPVFNDPPFSNSAEFKPLFDFYKNYLSFIYNENVAISNLEKNMELYSQWLNNRRIDTLWLSYDGTPIHFKESDTFIKFDGENLGAWALKNKMRIIDVPNCNIDDLHLNLDGHRKVANMIYNKLKKRHKLI